MSAFLFVAGDLSGDQHAARVAAKIKERLPDARVWAAGGPALRDVADVFIEDIVSKGVMGFWEPVKRIPWFRRLLDGPLSEVMANERPVVVATDFFGFNRWVIARAKRLSCSTAYFIGPQVWASRPSRAKILKKFVDRMLVIFPFEADFYRAAGLPAEFVGHPLIDAMPFPGDRRSGVEPTVGLLPGSRESEVRRLLPVFAQAAGRVAAKRPGARFVLFAAPHLPNALYDRLLASSGASPFFAEIVRDENYAWRSSLDAALVCSGTATLENALLGVPMVVAYKTSWPTYTLARLLIRVPYIAMPNILAGERLVEECVQSGASPQSLSSALGRLLDDASLREGQRRALLALRNALGGPGAAGRAAAAIAALSEAA